MPGETGRGEGVEQVRNLTPSSTQPRKIRRGIDEADLGGVSPLERDLRPPALGVDFRSPWLQDRVSLSLGGQIALTELRTALGPKIADLTYINRLEVLPIKASSGNGKAMYVVIDPSGCYSLAYHDRTALRT